MSLSKAEELQISSEEVRTMVERVNYMIRARNEHPFSEESERKIFEEWVTLAKRLRKGEEMIKHTIATVSADLLPSHTKYQKLVNLYDFLLSLLGFYDLFFKQSVSESQYKLLQGTILGILLD